MNQFGIPYRLPSFYRREVVKKREASEKRAGKHVHRLFIFQKTTQRVISRFAAEAAVCKKLQLIELLFEAGIPDSDIARYKKMFSEALPAERAVKITTEANIPSQEMRKQYRELEDAALQQKIADIEAIQTFRTIELRVSHDRSANRYP